MRCLAAMVILCTAAQAQRGVRPPGAGADLGPGQGPAIPFQEEEWEFWWFLNHETALDLRRRVHAADDPASTELTRADRDAAQALLLEHARGPSPTLRAACLMALAKCGAPETATVLAEALRDGNHELRMQAILAFGVLGDATQAPLLRERLDGGGNDPEQFQVGVALGLLIDPASLVALRELLGPERFAALSSPARRGLALGVGLTAESRLAGEVLQLLHRGRGLSSVVRAYLVLALGRVGGPEARGALLAFLDDDDTALRQAAALALGTLTAGRADAAVAEALAERLERESTAVTKNFLCIALGRVGGPIAARALMNEVIPRRSGAVRGGFVQPHLNLSDRSKGPFAALGLGLLDDLRAHDGLLRRFADTGDHSFQGALAAALSLTQHQRSIPVLRKEFQKTRDPVLRGHLALALGSLGDERSRGRLEAMLREEDDRELVPRLAQALALMGQRERAQEVLRARAEDRKRESSNVRRTLLYALGWVGDRHAVAFLCQVLADPEEPDPVREYAAIALGMQLDPLPQRLMARINTDSAYTLESGLLTTLRAVH